ncbi:hypothetical protein JCM21900_002154 [Sporobolomyces salmonicolor]
MVSLTDAIRSTPAYLRHGLPSDPYSRFPPSQVFDVSISPFWTIGSVAHGGYLLALLTRTSSEHQRLSASPHLDPAHLSSEFLTASIPGKAQVEVRVVSRAKRWTRLEVELWQYDHPGPDTDDYVHAERVLRVRAHYLFTDLPSPHPAPTSSSSSSSGGGGLTFLDRPCPLLEHPGQVDMSQGGTKISDKFRFKDGMRWAEVETKGEDEGGLKWGCWFELTGGEDVTESAALVPFFADCSKNGPELLPAELRPGPSWYPTLTFSLDFKSKFPLVRAAPSLSSSSSSGVPQVARRTFGLFATTKTIHAGRHDLTVEVWTAPCELGEKATVGEGWRAQARLVGVSTQMAITVPIELNHARARRSLPGDSSSTESESDGEGNGNGNGKARL